MNGEEQLFGYLLIGHSFHHTNHNLLFTLAQILLTVLLFFGLDILQKIDFIGQCLQIIENRKRRIVFTEQRSIDKRTDQRYYPDSFAGSLFTETRHIKKVTKGGIDNQYVRKLRTQTIIKRLYRQQLHRLNL